ncbi:MAG: thrombospondin type 3 repeat-containing protein [Alphaproteobacteria bacterium]|nr:thrombospondin type 3 repeat-containing protein [Alphaproteobacteria bacterium]
MIRTFPLLLAIACKGPVAPFPDSDDTDVDTDPPPPVDSDADGFTDDVDNCPFEPNPDQANLDGDSDGDACDVDVDGDQIPDTYDLFPTDGTRPGTSLPGSAYAHTATDLYRFDVNTNGIELVGAAVENGVAVGTLTDIAIDRYGVLYAITFDDLYVCHPQTAECWYLGDLPASSNGLTFLPAGTLLPNSDALVGIAQDGTWSQLTVAGATVTATTIGAYGGGWGSSGDVFSILGTGTFGAVDQGGDVVIVESDPATGAITRQVASVPYTEVYGLAGWEDAIFAFDASGDVLSIDPVTGAWAVVNAYGVEWYGAGVRTETAIPSF